MGTLEFSSSTKRVFDSQEGICHWGERLSQLFCLEMKKMESQRNNRLQVYKGLLWEDGDHLSVVSTAEEESGFCWGKKI